jgi:superfamily II DNA or RNA helicase
MNDYDALIGRKLSTVPPTGLGYVDSVSLPDGLFPHQSAIVPWALRRGRCAIFADTGLGKSRMQLAWADAVHKHTGHDVIILAPLAVAAQTVREGAEIGVEVNQCRDVSEVRSGITITNYDRLHRFDASRFGAVVLDESSIIKHHDAKTLAILLDAFKHAPFRLCATATPAPNDWTELGTHAEFLGICTRTEMLAEYFVHDGGDTQTWRLKGHARDVFWRWVASWAALVRKPSDLGYDDSRYNLPPLHVHQHIAKADHSTTAQAGMLFALEANTLSERRDARRASIADRVAGCAALVNADCEPWIVWCDLNAEGDALRSAIPCSVEIRGSDDSETKEKRLIDFAEGRIRVLITKPSIAGFGLNWQHCARMAFVGVTDSFEAYYQAVRRCWRFGQQREVHVHVFASELEGAVVANLRRKEQDATAMAEALSRETSAAVREQVLGVTRQTNPYEPRKAIAVPAWLKTESA